MSEPTPQFATGGIVTAAGNTIPVEIEPGCPSSFIPRNPRNRLRARNLLAAINAAVTDRGAADNA